MSSAPVYFIQPHVLDRLVSGQFVAKRQQSKNYQMRDRRNALSPLNVTRRAIRYEPLVFHNRRQEVLQCVKVLNHPQSKLVMVSGPPGRGKTSFLRAVAEMMGGGKEQLLWFDVSRHTDFDEVVRFLVEYLTYICRAAGEGQYDTIHEADPIATLERLLIEVEDFPILIVIDNMEYLVTPDQTVRSRELKEAFNFLLSFPNVKLILSGTSLPLQDMNPGISAVFHMALPPLPLDHARHLVHESYRNKSLATLEVEPLLPFFRGEPYLLTLFATLFERFPDIRFWSEQLYQMPDRPEQLFLGMLFPGLPEVEQQLLMLMAFVRHGMPPSGWKALMNQVNPYCGEFDFKLLDQSAMRPVLKKVYPPQMVLDKLRYRNEQDPDLIEPYYQLSELFMEQIKRIIPEAEQMRFHTQLQHFYLTEKAKHLMERIYPARTQHLAQEAHYHASRLKRRKLAAMTTDPFATDPGFAGKEIGTAERYAYGTSASHPNFHPARHHVDNKVLPWPQLVDEPVPDPSSWSTDDMAAFHSDMSSLVADTQTPLAPLKKQSAATSGVSDADMARLAELITRSSQPQVDEEREENSFILAKTSGGLRPVIKMPEMELNMSDFKEKDLLGHLQSAVDHQDADRVVETLLTLAQNRMSKLKAVEAQHALEQALAIAQEQNAPHLLSRVHSQLGRFYRERFQHNKAMRHLREVEHLYESGFPGDMDTEPLALAYSEIAEVLVYRQEFDKAIPMYQKSLQYLTTMISPVRADTLFRLALTLDESGQAEDAIAYYHKSFEVSQELQDNETCASTLYNLAGLYFENSQLAEAKATMEQCLIYDKRNGVEKDMMRSYLQLAKISEAQSDWTSAKVYASEAYALAEPGSANQVSLAMRLGQLFERAEAWKDALKLYRDALVAPSGVLSEEHRERLVRKIKLLEEKLG